MVTWTLALKIENVVKNPKWIMNGINLVFEFFRDFQIKIYTKQEIGNASRKFGICSFLQYLRKPTFQYFDCIVWYGDFPHHSTFWKPSLEQNFLLANLLNKNDGTNWIRVKRRFNILMIYVLNEKEYRLFKIEEISKSFFRNDL